MFHDSCVPKFRCINGGSRNPRNNGAPREERNRKREEEKEEEEEKEREIEGGGDNIYRTAFLK